MRFRESLWDDSEPEYAPCSVRIRGIWRWIPPKKYKEAGYSIKTFTLDGPHEATRSMQQAAQCRALTREMLEWFDGQTTGKQEGTWGWLIGRFIHDENSPIQDVGAQTRKKYRETLAKVEDAIGTVRIDETDYDRLVGWRRRMESKGRSKHYIKKWFTHWGLALSHGIRIGARYGIMDDCLRIKGIRSEMRISNGAKRSVACTREQVEAIVAEADKLGMWQLSLSVLLRFEFMLRGVNVYGEWEPVDEGDGGIIYQTASRRLRWVKGATWEEIDRDVTVFEKLISKTANSLPEPYEFDLTNTPHIRERLLQIPEDQRVGPVIKMDDGMPPRNDLMTKQFKRIVRALELPDELRISDNRAGGITEAKTLVDPFELRDAAQHTQISTTDRYVRNRSESANNVVAMRAAKR